MALSLNVRSGPTQEYFWSHEGPTVRLGRSPECELQMSGDSHQTVSWEHAKIELRPGGAFVTDLGSSNGTYLNGRKIDARTLLRKHDVISLGQMGPQVMVLEPEPPGRASGIGAHGTALVAASPMSARGAARPPVQPGGAAAATTTPVSATRLMLVAMQRRSRMTWFTAVAGAIAAISVILAIVYFQAQHAKRVAADLAAQKAAFEKNQLDFEKSLSAVKTQAAKLGSKVEENDKKIAAITEADAANLHRKFAEAVYLVRWMEPEGEAMATAFAISPFGVFATNAHVAQPVQAALARGEKVLLISQRGVKKLPVTAAEHHPLYVDNQNTPDVGILRARLPPGQSLKSVVQLASDSELQNLRVGSPLCYMGFPAFQPGDYSSYAKVNARTYQGRLNRLLTLEGTTGEFGNQHLIEHDMYSWGGASGSPIFNAQGKVVAVHSSANPVTQVVELGDAEKSIKLKFDVRNPASAKWGMRVDLLRELYAP